jgi:hypothetical protein
MKYLAALRFVALPIAVLILANVIFEFVAFDIDKLIGELAMILGQEESSGRSFLEARARLLWGTSVFIYYATFIAVTIFNVLMIRKALAAKEQIVLAAVTALMVGLILGYLVISDNLRNNFSYIYLFTFETLLASNLYTSFQILSVKALVLGLNVLAAFVPMVVLIAGCCVLIEDRNSNISDLKRLETQMRRLKMIISSGSILMVVGILHMITWLRWPAALVSNEWISLNVVNFSESLGLYWGATFSLMIAVFYLPAALHIQQRCELIISEQPELLCGMEPQVWLKKHGLSVSPLQQMPQIAVILAPILAGPIGSAVTDLSSSLIAG